MRKNLFDISGEQTGFSFTGKHMLYCLLAVVLGVVCLFLPISAITFEAKIALGILVGSTIMFMTQCLPTICIITLSTPT